MNDANDNYHDLLLEQLHDDNRKLLEAVSDMQKQVGKISGMEARLDDVAADVKIIKAAVTDVSHQVTDHEQRITRLESAA